MKKEVVYTKIQIDEAFPNISTLTGLAKGLFGGAKAKSPQPTGKDNKGKTPAQIDIDTYNVDTKVEVDGKTYKLGSKVGWYDISRKNEAPKAAQEVYANSALLDKIRKAAEKFKKTTTTSPTATSPTATSPTATSPTATSPTTQTSSTTSTPTTQNTQSPQQSTNAQSRMAVITPPRGLRDIKGSEQYKKIMTSLINFLANDTPINVQIAKKIVYNIWSSMAGGQFETLILKENKEHIIDISKILNISGINQVQQIQIKKYLKQWAQKNQGLVKDAISFKSSGSQASLPTSSQSASPASESTPQQPVSTAAASPTPSTPQRSAQSKNARSTRKTVKENLLSESQINRWKQLSGILKN